MVPTVAAAIAALTATGIVIASTLAKSFKGAGSDNGSRTPARTRAMRVRELKLRSTFVTHAKMVIDRGAHEPKAASR